MEMKIFDNKPVVLITGCSEGGIGNALARAFASENCFVVATSRSLASMRDLDDDNDNQSSRFFLQELDVLSEQSVGSVVSNVIQRFGRIDIVVNNAGIHCVGPLAEIPLSAMESTFNTNVYVSHPVDSKHWNVANAVSALRQLALRQCRGRVADQEAPIAAPFVSVAISLAGMLSGPMRLIQAVVPHMAARRKGKIVNVGSVAALVSGPWAGAYSASKAALHALTSTLRMELRPFGINVITVVPGAIKSNIGSSSIASYNRMPEWKLYKSFENSIRARTSISQGAKSTPAEEFAKKTVAAVLKKNPPAWFSYGFMSTLLAIAYHLPIFITDLMFRKVMKV